MLLCSVGLTLTQGLAAGGAKRGPWDIAERIEEQWYYHAVAQVILAHSLTRSFPEVDANRTGVTGISWGGILTSTTMGIDDRFTFAVPVYGCGFLPGSDGHQGRAIKNGKHRETVEKHYDGSAYFSSVRMPTLWANGTNDFHFAMPATQKSSQAVKGPSTLRFQHGMRHGHIPGWAPKEIYVFAESVVRGGVALPQLGELKVSSGAASCAYTSTRGVRKAELLYTADTCIWPDRKWRSIPAKIADNKLAATVPKGAVAVFFSHGIGHTVGLGVRDVGGKAPGREAGRKCCGVAVRLDLPLEEGLLVTVEPGIYFVPAMLDDPENRDRFRDQVNWDALDAWRPVGGVRIEDNVLIRPKGPRVMTSEISK